jgi:protein-tyrosine kinase
MSTIRTTIERAKRQRAARAGGAPVEPSLPAPSDGARYPENVIRLSEITRLEANWSALQAARIITEHTRNPAEPAYRMVRTRIMRKMRSNDWRVLGISSLGPGEGKTYTAVNLAISIAAEVDQEAVLIDMDLRRPSVYKYLGVDPGSFRGLTEYLEGDGEDLESFFVCPGIDRLGCLLTSVPLDRPSDLLGSPRGREFFAQLRERLPRETVIVVDLPPLLAADDALAVAPMLDGLLFVVAEGQTKRDDVNEARELLAEFNLVGTLLNKSVERENRSYYY